MIKAIITDFDGTLVDTFEANFCAYQKAMSECGIHLSVEKYRECFGYRYDRFLAAMDIKDEEIAQRIKELKKEYYPQYFEHLVPNESLIELIATFRQMGGRTAIASTARKKNLTNAVGYLGIGRHFDFIIAGIDVKQGKPNPEIYLKAMEALHVTPEETLVFEDSEVGIQAAKASGAHYIQINL